MSDTTVLVRHDADIEITYNVISNSAIEAGERKRVVKADMLNAALTVGAAMYVGNSSHRHGRATYSLKILNGQLREGELCTCEDCEAGLNG